MANTTLTNESYTVGLICALEDELAACQGMLDEEHPDLSQVDNDSNAYSLGSIGQHNVVIACLPSGTMGTNAAATTASNMLRSFPKIRFGLMVGIGGGAPDPESSDPMKDIRLGDIVVSTPDDTHGGVVQYDYGKTVKGGQFIRKGCLNKPPTAIGTAVIKLRARHRRSGSKVSAFITEMLKANPAMQEDFQHQGSEQDRLFKADYEHLQPNTDCKSCDETHLVSREPRRNSTPVIHYGLIASANQVMRHGATRERIRRELGIRCFEMEAAGLMDNFPCLVIRGICDYSDSHKNKRWQPHAAAAAAAYAKELILSIPKHLVASATEAVQVMKLVKDELTAIDKKIEPLLNGTVLVNTSDQAHELLIQTETQNKKRQQMLDWLASRGHEDHHADIIEKRTENTGGWFLNSPQVDGWIQRKFDTLYCPGIPGSGKTIMAAFMVNNLRQLCTTRPSSLAFFYCSYNKREEQKPRDLLRSILRQVCESAPILPEPLEVLYTLCQTERRQPSQKEVSRILRLLIIENIRHLYLVIDALDELKSEVRKEIVEELQNLQEKTPISLLATSRPLEDLAHLKRGGEIEIRASDDDIGIHLGKQVRFLSSCITEDKALVQKVKDAIVRAARGMFLLAQLHLDSLKGKRTKQKVFDTLESLPKGEDALKKAYSGALQRIRDQNDPNDRELAHRVLCWVVHAKRPLTPVELQHAVAIKYGSRTLTKDDLAPPAEMISLCAGLVILNRQSDAVELVHYTTKSFFEQCREKWIADGPAILSRACLSYLSLEELVTDASTKRWSNHEYIQREKYVMYPLLQYCGFYWGDHVRSSQDEVLKTTLKFLRDERATIPAFHILRGIWSFGEVCSENARTRGLVLAAGFGLHKIFETLLDMAESPNTNGIFSTTSMVSSSYARRSSVGQAGQPFYYPSLKLACWRGRLEVVQLLSGFDKESIHQGDLQACFSTACEGSQLEIAKLLIKDIRDIDYRDSIGGYPILLSTSSNGYMKIVQLLLDHGADVNAETEGAYPCALSAAVASGQEAIARVLLDNGASLDLKEDLYSTLLNTAVRNRDEDTTRLLIERSTRIHAETTQFGSILCAACENGSETMIQLLVEWRQGHVDYDTPEKWLVGALRMASIKGNKRIVQQLLDIGARSYKDGLTRGGFDEALYYSAENGHSEVVQLLLENGASTVRWKGRVGSAIHAACEAGHENVVQVLIDNGTDLEAFGKHPGFPGGALRVTPLYLACHKGHEKVVALLIENKANTNADCGIYGRPIYAAGYSASSRSSETIMRLLLDSGAAISATGGRYGDALRAACVRGDSQAVNLLLCRGAQYNNLVGRFGTALQAASWAGKSDIVELLLDRNADINASGGEFGNALQAACYRGHGHVVQLLLRHGADVNAVGGEFGSALQTASHWGFKDIVQHLLNNKANVNALNGRFGTALQAASHWGFKDIVRILLGKGADVNAIGGYFGHALLAAQHGNGSDCDDICQMLIEHGARVDAEG